MKQLKKYVWIDKGNWEIKGYYTGTSINQISKTYKIPKTQIRLAVD